MAEELQPLIEKIQKEAIEKAEEQASEIISKARDKAASEVKEAEQKAESIIAKAKQDAERYMDRSIRTLEQAARDVLITVGQGVENILDDLVRDSLDEALDIDVVKDMLARMAETYIAREGKERRIKLLVNEEDQEKLIRFYADRYRKKLGEGIEIKADKGIGKGFKVSFVDEHAHHDFTRDAIAEALANFLRPHLADIIFRVAREGEEEIEEDLKNIRNKKESQ